jgi:hypothetical protein
VRKQMYAFDEESRRTFGEYLARRLRQPHFSNARSVRNAIDRLRLRQATRILEQGGIIPFHELARIDAADIRKSRVFQGLPDAPPRDADSQALLVGSEAEGSR